MLLPPVGDDGDTSDVRRSVIDLEQLHRIPLHRAYRSQNEEAYVLDALRSGTTQGDGPYTERCHRLLRQIMGTRHVLLTTSGTTALEMGALLARRSLPGEPAGEVICPAYTFMSSAGAFLLHGYRPVFADVREDTLNLDEAHVEALIGPQTRAIVAVHYAGVPAAMDRLRALADRHDVTLIEDAAHAIGASFQGRPVGSLGDMAAFSFHATKNVSCGEGGAVTVNRPELVARSEYIRDKGTNREEFRRGKVPRYGWVDIGGSYLPSDILAAHLLAQLEDRGKIQRLRKARFQSYMDGLAPLEQAGLLRLPRVPDDVEPSYHLFHVLVEDEATRDALSESLRLADIAAYFHYPALHLTREGRRYGPAEGSLPVAEAAASRLLRLPLYPDLDPFDLERVVDAIGHYFRRR
ncbi:MAG: dTDP-4-amino-4,6-dideoxygalactose transaminase [Myxococcota bacterium]